MKAFHLLEPKTLAEAVDCMKSSGPSAKFLAGGTDVIVGWQSADLLGSENGAPTFVSLKHLEDLNQVSYDPGKHLKVGALVTHAMLAKDEIVNKYFSLLAAACSQVGSPQIRNVATIGGNLCNASPAADSSVALLALDARVKLLGANGEREVPLEQFFTGPGNTVLHHGEILTSIIIPDISGCSGRYIKLGQRSSLEIAIVSAAVSLQLEKNFCCKARVALGAVAPVPLRATKTEEYLQNKELTDAVIEECALLAVAESNPISDSRASSSYRKEMVKELVKKALGQILLERRCGQ